LEYSEGNEYSHEDLASLVQHIDEKRPHLKAALCYVALWNLKNGRYSGEQPNIFKSTTQTIEEVLRQDEEHYDFFETSARLIEALRQDEKRLEDDKANRATYSSIWAEKKWEWHLFQQ
jgi:hypothetical protein